jgi:plasmid stabilization system protein ParE
MQLRWTEEAANDLERIADYLLLHAPDRAEELLRRVYDAPTALLAFPNRGRPGKREGTSLSLLRCRTSLCTRFETMSCLSSAFSTVPSSGRSGRRIKPPTAVLGEISQSPDILRTINSVFGA